uniref:Uncharacterized protein n=1 Tax=Anopheles albimanus TaxID=7167 RepID=A0A182FGM9_ANOAL
MTSSDLEGSELSALEEQLYSSIHHTFDESANQDGNMQWPQSFVGATSTPSRVVSNTSVMNNIQPRASKMKRYWAPNTPQQTANPVRSFTRDQTEARGIAKSATHPNQSMAAIPRQQAGTQQTSTEHSTGDPKRSLFAPYQSLLSSWQLQRNPDGTGNAESNPVSNGAQSPGTKEKKRKKKQSPKHPVEKKLASLVSLVEEAEGEQKEAAKQRIQAKKSKATAVRNKLADKACSKLRVVAEISLDSSDDETRAPSRTAKLKPSSVPPSDDDTTDVELIPAPPPPKICIDCSDDEVAQDSFVLPKSKRTKKKKEPKNASSPRCLSPSNSSIISDDFIGHNDRSRLNESFTDTIPNDDELETECLLRESLQTNRKSRSMTKERNKRVPSVSSDGTVGTASDATDQDRRTSDISGGKTPKGVLLPTSGSKTGRSDEISGGNAPLGKPSQNDEQMVLKTKSKVKKSAAASGHGRSKSHSPASQGPMAENHLMIEEKNATARANTVEQPPVPKGKTKPKNKANQSYSTAGIDTAVSSNKAGKAASKPSLRSKHDPESESMYQEISKISNKPKNDTVCYDDSSVSSESDYNITFISNKSSANATESRKGGSGNEEANGTIVLDRMQDVSSESDIEEFLQRSSKEPTGSIKKPTAESAKAAKKRSTGTKRRKKYNSENLSDEEFACMLTDIVQAVSDGDDDDDDDDDEDNLEFEVQGIEPTTQVPDQNAAVSEGIEATAQPPPEQQQSTTEEKGKKKKRRRVASTSDHTTTVTLSDTDDDVVEISDIEDNVPLVQKFKRNNNAKQCSICGRANHQAHNCYVPARIFSCPIPSENVHSYRPIYPFHIGARKSCPPETGSGTKQSDVQARQHEASSRNYEASSCELNLEALIENPNGFYHRFVETMGLLKKQPVPSEQVIVIGTKDFETDEQQQQRGLRVFQRNKKPRIDGHSSSVASPTASDQQKETPGHIKEETNTMLEGVEPTETKADDATAVVTLPEGGITEDSNYSFSELLGADGEAQVSTVNITMPSITPPRPQSENENHPKAELDFIPLNGPSEQEDCNVSQVNSQDEIVEKNSADLAIAKQPTLNAKICLSKENAKLLLSPSGQEFLRLARMKHEVTLMITFELVGNVLHVGGSAAQQDGFRAELVQFLKDQELSAYNKKMILLSSVPKKSQKAVRHITLFFEQLLKPYGNVKKLFDRYIHAQQGGLQLQACERARRTLNMVLFGVYGMREGRSRMNQLIRQVAELKKYQPKQEIDPSLRQIINEHMVYIFSPYDHGNYKQIFTEFQRLNQLQQLKKVTYVELGLPDPILLDMSLYPMVADEEADFKGDDFASQFVEIINPQKTREYNENLMKRQKVPMFANKLAFLITVHFKRLLKRFDSVKNMFHRYVRVQQEVIQSKEVEKARIQLNMVLFGVYGMREGRKRMSQLIQAAGTLKKSTEKLDLSAQKIISENLAYIFSSYDHGNYTKIVAEYQQLRKQQRLSKITAKDLGLKGRLALSTHHCFPLTNTNEVDDHDAFDESNQTEEENDDDGEEVEQQQEQQQPNNPNAGDHDPTKESLILNTFDQMIDPQRLEWLDRASRCHGEEDEDYQMQLQLPQLVENILFSNCSIAPGQRRQQHQHQQQHYLPDRFASVRAASNRVGGRRHRDDRQCANTFTPPNSRWPSSKFNQIMAEQEEKILRCLRLAHSTKGMRHLTDRIDFISKRANRGPLRPIDRSELDKILHILSNKRRHPTQAANRGRRVNARFAPNYRHSY